MWTEWLEFSVRQVKIAIREVDIIRFEEAEGVGTDIVYHCPTDGTKIVTVDQPFEDVFKLCNPVPEPEEGDEWKND